MILQKISWLCCLQNLFTNKKQTIVNLRLNIDNILHTMCVSVSESILYFQKFVSKKSLCIKNHFRSFFISAKIFFFSFRQKYNFFKFRQKAAPQPIQWGIEIRPFENRKHKKPDHLRPDLILTLPNLDTSGFRIPNVLYFPLN